MRQRLTDRRCPRVSPVVREAIAVGRGNGMTYAQLASRFGVSVSSAWRVSRSTR